MSPPGNWIHCLVAHSLIHAGFVWLITGCAVLGAVEFVLHALLDGLKCEGRISFHMDQLFHVGCKVLYVAVLMMGF